MSRTPLWVLAAALLPAITGCNSTFKLNVDNQTAHDYRLQVGGSEALYHLAAKTQVFIPATLQRSQPYRLVAVGSDGKEHSQVILSQAGQLFVELRESNDGRLEWGAGQTPP